MRVLLLHNTYLESGGEDAAFEAEAHLLRRMGVTTRSVIVRNEHAHERLPVRLVQIGLNACWSRQSYKTIRDVCEEFQPDVAHVHNFWMKFSPSVHAACHSAGVPTVQTFHNFRLMCVNGNFLRDGRPCQDCLNRTPWRGVVRRCYRQSAAASAVVAAMTLTNRGLGTWTRVGAFIALSEHSRSKFIIAGIPPDRMFVKPNFVDLPDDSISPPDSDLILFVGRLSPEKGLRVLLTAWSQNKLDSYGRLCILGDGPLRTELEKAAAGLKNVVFTGALSPSQVRDLLRRARAVVVPSVCFENFPRIIAEAFAHGRPVVGSSLGAVGEIVKDGYSGLTFPPGDAAALGHSLRRMLTDESLAQRLGANAREEFLRKYTATRNFDMLLRIYRFATESSPIGGKSFASAM